MHTRRVGVVGAVVIVDRVLELIDAEVTPGLDALALLLEIEVKQRPGAALELLGRYLRICSELPRVPQVARGIARYLIRCGYACEETALMVALIERCERPPVTAAQHARIYALFSYGGACA